MEDNMLLDMDFLTGSLIQEKVNEWKKTNLELKVLEKRSKELSDELVNLCGQEFEGFGIKIAQVERKGNIDYAVIPEIRQVDLEKYRKPSSTYTKITLSLKEDI